jgi:hypothetical protein
MREPSPPPTLSDDLEALLLSRAKTIHQAIETAIRFAQASAAPEPVVTACYEAAVELERALGQNRGLEAVLPRAARAYDALERWQSTRSASIPGYYLG